MRSVLVAVVAVVLVGCGGGGDGTHLPTPTVREGLSVIGTFTLDDGELETTTGGWSTCSGTGGYSDFGAGMNVTVRDGDGSIVGTGSTRNLATADLDDPMWKTIAGAAEGHSPKNIACTVVFEVPVKDVEFYAVSVGSRGELTFSKADLESADWHVEMSLGA